MTSKAVGLFVLGVLLMTEVEAQQYREIDRTLDTVFVKARRVERSKEVNIGTRVSKLDEGLLLDNQTKSLSEVLADHSTIYIKSLGQGALSTSSFRGTSSSHTQVNWNGININPAMSSSFDFSQIPAFFTDGVSLYHGSSHLKGGSGGLGGSINLSNQPAWNDP
ncbi:MAG: TonB-dependent receptor plug domain-containing protein, partial [Bacteroides sp.]